MRPDNRYGFTAAVTVLVVARSARAPATETARNVGLRFTWSK